MTERAHGPGYLLLEDGTRFEGDRFIGDGPALGEVVFNTAHSGYQEILSDPSYYRQILVFTAPHLGNVGVNSEDLESDGVPAAGAVARSLAPHPRSWRADRPLVDWLAEERTPLLVGADTRAITLHCRSRGAMRAGLFPAEVPPGQALAQVQASAPMLGADLASLVSCAEPYRFEATRLTAPWHCRLDSGSGLRVTVLDCGVKRSILAELARRGCEVLVVPAGTSAASIAASGCDGVVLSNGPGDPAALTRAVATVRELLVAGRPVFGICLGHQLLALAAGATTFKLLFGHRGANHPVRRESDRAVEITSQNHGFAVRADDLPDDWRITHLNLNDGTVEGLAHRRRPFFSVQYHPEASPGPHDAAGYFDRFIEAMRRAP